MAQTSTEQGQYDFKTLPTKKRIRARIGGVFVADSRAARLFVKGHPRAYMVPAEDVRHDLVVDRGGPVEDPALGKVRHASLSVDGRIVEDAVRFIEADPDRPDRLRDTEGLALIPWSKPDAWYEEDEEVYVHPRDPFTRIDVVQSSRHVVVERDGVQLAETRRPMILFETGLPPRYYMPQTDVDLSLLVPSDKTTQCPYKGTATYHHVKTSKMHKDLVWCYQAPFDEVHKVQGMFCFFDERVDMMLDGAAQTRPKTQWSKS